MQKYRIDLCYNGKQFCGWQRQPNGSSVQGCIEEALATITGERVSALAASRTDSGVHANHQVLTFSTARPINLERVLLSLQALVPESVGFRSIVAIGDEFHPIASAKSKIYRYRFRQSYLRDPFLDEFCWRHVEPFDPGKMSEAAGLFVGTHDFTSFCAMDSNAKAKVRNVMDAQILASEGMVDFWIQGAGFLKQMVRIMAGTLASVGRGKLTPAEVGSIMASCDRKQAGKTAPAQGLTLMHIDFSGRLTLDEFLKDYSNQPLCLRR